jgi:8-oxo-dGTP pyrophosphatase MutT (NUDIX family)
MSVGTFLSGVGALIWEESSGKYLLLRRARHRDFQGGAWECVTGRVDQGESYEDALRREVREEINGEIQIELLIATTHFYRGETRSENELLGVIYGCTLKNPDEITPGVEHSEWGWFTIEEAFEFLPGGHWLQNVIRRAEQMKAAIPAELREVYRNEGFNIG